MTCIAVAPAAGDDVQIRIVDRGVYFSIQSPGCAFPGGGTTLEVVRGGRVELNIRRLNVAEWLYRGKLFWLWGDTDRPNGPLGNLDTTATGYAVMGPRPKRRFRKRCAGRAGPGEAADVAPRAGLLKPGAQRELAPRR